LYCNPLDDSHEHLISAAGLRDDRLPGAADWVRVEYVPGADPRVLPWAYSLDETARPDWLDAASEERCCSALRAIAEQILAPVADAAYAAAVCAADAARVADAAAVATRAGAAFWHFAREVFAVCQGVQP